LCANCVNRWTESYKARRMYNSKKPCRGYIETQAVQFIKYDVNQAK
jgi:hypothetical protein